MSVGILLGVLKLVTVDGSFERRFRILRRRWAACGWRGPKTYVVNDGRLHETWMITKIFDYSLFFAISQRLVNH